MVLREDNSSPGPRCKLQLLSAHHGDITTPDWLRHGLIVESRKMGESVKQKERGFWEVLPCFQKETQSSNLLLSAFDIG